MRGGKVKQVCSGRMSILFDVVEHIEDIYMYKASDQVIISRFRSQVGSSLIFAILSCPMSRRYTLCIGLA